MKMGKYLAKYVPNHPRATKEGCVYEHVLVAEKNLDRYLENGEVVHHIDEDKYNNSPNNLMVFKTMGDHSGFHKGLKPTKINGVYECLDKKPKQKTCPICNNVQILGYSKMCKSCQAKNRNRLKNTLNIDKEVLKNEIYYNSYTAMGLKYGVSDNAVKKWLKSFNIKECNKLIIKLIPYNEWMSESFSKETIFKIQDYRNKLKEPKIKKDVRRKIYQINKDTKEIIREFDSIKDANLFFNKDKHNGNIKEACRIRDSHNALGYLWYYKEDIANSKQL